jgi:hypothetical protein
VPFGNRFAVLADSFALADETVGFVGVECRRTLLGEHEPILKVDPIAVVGNRGSFGEGEVEHGFHSG